MITRNSTSDGLFGLLLTAALCAITACDGGSAMLSSHQGRTANEPPGGVVPQALGVVSVPRAACGPGSSPETGLQGQVTQDDRDSGRAELGYSCNLERVGQHRHGEGASWQFAWYDDCGYYGTLADPGRTTEQGTVVVNASDPENPFGTAVLSTPAMMDPHESLKVNERRGLLAAVDLGDDVDRNGTLNYFDIYDVQGDCSHPQLLASTEIIDTTGHEGNWGALDGRTYFGSGDLIAAIDVEDPTDPYLFHLFDRSSHGLSVSADGNRLYTSDMAILDISDIQARADSVSISEIGSLTTLYCSQHPLPFTVKGVPYLICAGEIGREPGAIIDISDETNPTMVAALELEVHLPQNSAFIAPEILLADNSAAIAGFVEDPNLYAAVGAVGGAALVTYDGHYCSVDRSIEASIAVCGYMWSGIRVFDIRNPASPKEIAYYIPPAIVEDAPLLGSANQNGEIGPNVADKCPAQVRIIPERGELWTQCQDNEFLVLRFTNGVWPFDEM